MLPVLREPEASAAILPAPASNPYAATKPRSGATGTSMSRRISAADSARSKTRTSSMSPAKCSPYGRLPPIHSGVSGVWIRPVASCRETSRPST